jgi:putative ABC transport system ATP-binding protein
VIYQFSGMRKVWQGSTSTFVLSVERLGVARGEGIGILGPSGCGKSTLLDVMGLILSPNSAAVFRFAPLPDRPVDVAELWASRRRDALAALRARHISYVFQVGGLLPFLTVRQNIELPRRMLNLPRDGRVEELADALDIRRLLPRLPGSLSVGERQRTAVARALARDPAVVLADEPTASLDPVNAGRVLSELRRLSKDAGATLVVTTHDASVVSRLQLRTIAHKTSFGSKGEIISSFAG